MRGRRGIVCLVVLGLASVLTPAVPRQPTGLPVASATIRGLGALPGGPFYSQAYGLSADGRVVVGQAAGLTGREACRWIDGGAARSLGPVTVGPIGAVADAASDDGAVIAGSRQRAATQFEAYRYSDPTGLVLLGDLPGGPENSIATDVSSHGEAIVGQSFGPLGIEAYLWTGSTGMQPLGDLPGGPFASNALGISGDGRVVIGHGNSASGIEGWRWTAATGMVALGDFPGGEVESSAEGISRNGVFIVGFGQTAEGRLAFRWTESDGLMPLGELHGGGFGSWEAVSDDGNVVVGLSDGSAGHEAFLWTPSLGMVPLAPLLRLFGAAGLDGWRLEEVTGLTPDGRSLVGNGINPSGQREAWYATLPDDLDCEPPSCVACVDGDGDGFGDPGVPTNLCPVDDCPHDPDPLQTDRDGDGLGDACDRCPLDAANDADGDGACGDADNCPARFNPEQADSDDDGPGDSCDNCPLAENTGQLDGDGDGAGDACDLCPVNSDPGQQDADGDGRGDRCDNCPPAANPLQEDRNADGAGDACQPTVAIDAIEPGAGVLLVRAGALEPQGEPIDGRLEIYEEAARDIALPDPGGALRCDAGDFPGGRPGEGFGFAFASIGTPVLFDLDSNLGCVDGLPDVVLGRGRCAAPTGAFDTILDLTGVGPGAVVCVRAVNGAEGSGSDLTIQEIRPDLLRGRLASGSRLVAETPFAPGLPRRTDISGLTPGAFHRLVLFVTDHHTPTVGAEAAFVPDGESWLVLNRPPVAAASAPAAVECESPEGAPLLLDGSGSSDPDVAPGEGGEIARYEWILDPGGAGERLLAEGRSVTAVLPLGTHAVVLRVTDVAGESDEALVGTTVQDTTPPSLALVATPNSLWPPNHRRVRVRIAWSASDRCDPAPRVTLAAVSSSEPDDALGSGDGNTTGDISGAAPGSADGEIWLRAERDGGGPGRVYLVAYQAVDAAGNAAEARSQVIVPAHRGAGLDPSRLRYRPDRAAVGVTAP